jgi:hypothetical protein
MALRRGKKDKRARAVESEVDEIGSQELETEEPTTGDSTAGSVAEQATESSRADRRPLDEAEAGDDDVLPRLDLGGLRVPVLPETEVRVELNELQQPIAASVLHAGSAVQILAFAAPRNGGIWDEVRAEIAESVRVDGGRVEEHHAAFGAELRARVKAEVQPGQLAEQDLRFVGFDGPRWFVRGVFSGPAATDPKRAGVLEEVLTSVVVVRGTDAMAPRDPLPLRLPREVTAPAEEAAGQEGSPRPGLQLPDRGPEITETR